MNYTVLLGKILFKLDDYLGRLKVQIGLFILIMSSLLFTDFKLNIWLSLGLVCYFGMFAWDYHKNPNYREELEAAFKEKNGKLGFLKGFNYSVILGPVSILLKIFLSRLDEIDEENIKTPIVPEVTRDPDDHT